MTQLVLRGLCHGDVFDGDQGVWNFAVFDVSRSDPYPSLDTVRAQKWTFLAIQESTFDIENIGLQNEGNILSKNSFATATHGSAE